MDQSTQKQTPQQPATPVTQPAGATQQNQSAQPTQPVSVQTQPKIQVTSVSGSVEEGSAMIVAEVPDADADDEEEIKVAPQETKNQVVSQSAGADVQEEVAELQLAVPEVVTSSAEVEKLIEITPPEQPKISQELKKIGVTHSGPGIIDAAQSAIPTSKIPVTFEQAITQEELIKDNRLHTSKFWLLEKIKYLWRKVNPDIGLTIKKQTGKKIIPGKKLPVKTNPVQVATTQVASKSNQVSVQTSSNTQ